MIQLASLVTSPRGGGEKCVSNELGFALLAVGLLMNRAYLTDFRRVGSAVSQI